MPLLQSNVSPAQATEAHCHCGAGYIGVEFANIMNGLGSEVTKRQDFAGGSMTTSALGFRMATQHGIKFSKIP